MFLTKSVFIIIQKTINEFGIIQDVEYINYERRYNLKMQKWLLLLSQKLHYERNQKFSYLKKDYPTNF